MNCFICKRPVDNEELDKVANIKLPNGDMGYAHMDHPGVEDLSKKEKAKK